MQLFFFAFLGGVSFFCQDKFMTLCVGVFCLFFSLSFCCLSLFLLALENFCLQTGLVTCRFENV